MKTRNLLALATLTVIALTGCSNNDDEAVTMPDLTGTPVQINAGVDAPGTTRAGHTTGALTEGSFGLFFATTDDADSRYNASNLQMEYADGSWSAQDGTKILWKDNTTEVSYYAYYPYSTSAVTAGSNPATSYQLTVPLKQTEQSIKVADFLYAAEVKTTGNGSGNGSINISFKHQLTQLNITLTKGTEVADDLTFESVKLDGCASGRTYDLSTGEWGSTTVGAETITALLNGSNAECIIIPQSFTSDKGFKVTITASNGKTYTYESNAEQEFKSGFSYTLPLTVGRDKVEIGEITAAEWTTTEGGDLVTE